MGAAFSHFTENERFTLEKLRKEGFSFGHIANILGKSKSSISREYNRNQVEQFKNGKYQMVYCTRPQRILVMFVEQIVKRTFLVVLLRNHIWLNS